MLKTIIDWACTIGYIIGFIPMVYCIATDDPTAMIIFCVVYLPLHITNKLMEA